MTESELSFFELLSQFDDPESPDRSDRVVHLAKYIYPDDDEDDDDEETFTPEEKMFGIYYKYLTPAERKKFAAIPTNDPSYEIKILRKMLYDTFALVPMDPRDWNRSLTPKFQIDLITTICRLGFVLARLIAWYMKLNYTKNRTADLIWEALGEIDPRATDE